MKRKNIKSQIILDLIMVPVSIFMSFQYYPLTRIDKALLKDKIVCLIWILAIFGWSTKLILDLIKKRKILINGNINETQ